MGEHPDDMCDLPGHDVDELAPSDFSACRARGGAVTRGAALAPLFVEMMLGAEMARAEIAAPPIVTHHGMVTTYRSQDQMMAAFAADMATGSPCWLPYASERERGGSWRSRVARPATPDVLQGTDARADRLANPDLAPGPHGPAVVAVGAAQGGGRDRIRRRGCPSTPTRSGDRERCAPPPSQRAAPPQQAAETACHRSAEAAARCAVASIVAAGDRRASRRLP